MGKEPGPIEKSIAEVVKSAEGIDPTTAEGGLYHKMVEIAVAGSLVILQTSETPIDVGLATILGYPVKSEQLRTAVLGKFAFGGNRVVE